ncbi:hypothetical protein [Metabacillus malikii]|uniref:Phospholipid phosphatase n=1 Tax=Metabacillus malikii TaxID=1504265 RepID=A0ABT9ZCQ9_9BACI|nr:hypothetical protein [Metabacillus malikii]MDQ0229596.1 hypothetical protein [Metabacillus malikii]
MDVYIYTLLLIGYVLLFIWGVMRSSNPFPYANVLILLTLGLIYDNLIIAIGTFIGEGNLLKSLSTIRFWLHAFITPTLVLFGYGVLTKTSLKWVKTRTFHLFTWGYFLTIIFIELATVTFHLTLKASNQYGVLHYTYSGEPSIPYMVIGISLWMLISSFLLMKEKRFIWMFIGTIVMTLGGALPLPFPSSATMNIFEFVFLITLWYTKNRI